MTYCKWIASNSNWYFSDNELMTNIWAKFFSVKTAPVKKLIHLLKLMQFEFLMKEIIILYRHYFNWH